MIQSSIGSWTENHAKGTIHPHPEGRGLLYPLTPLVKATLVTGPRRLMFLASGTLQGVVAASPGRDMMITGGIGLVKAWKRKEDLWR